jgi:ParB family transcriptional regulator, chromosome partitioning protein
MREGKVKRAFDLSAITADLPTFPDEGEAPREAMRPRSPAVPIAKAIETQHRNAMAELKALEAEIDQRKAVGLVIEEIDATLADPSPYWDRDQRFLQDKSFTDFVEDIRRNGQQSPALVRPHPSAAGRFEVCFGHRRVFACRSLGLRLRAVVQNLSEAQMAGAAYSENAHREGVSTLEQSRALARYVDRGVFPSKQALADALNVSRSHVSNLTSFAEIPDLVLDALGDWRKCTFRDASNLLKATREPPRKALMLEAAQRLVHEEHQLGFSLRLALLLGQKPAGAGGAEDLRDDSGRVIAELKRGRRSTAIGFAPDQSTGLADFVWSKMPSLLAEFHRRHGKQK